MEEFYKIANQIHNDRIIEKNKIDIDDLAKKEYSMFCIWSRAFYNGVFSEENFKLYQKIEKKSINFWIKKRICELFFNYEFEFDYDKNKWKYYKKSHS